MSQRYNQRKRFRLLKCNTSPADDKTQQSWTVYVYYQTSFVTKTHHEPEAPSPVGRTFCQRLVGRDAKMTNTPHVGWMWPPGVARFIAFSENAASDLHDLYFSAELDDILRHWSSTHLHGQYRCATSICSSSKIVSSSEIIFNSCLMFSYFAWLSGFE